MSSVMVMMSGGVDSSVAAALLRNAGHDVTGVTLRLWGGPSDSGCCSVSDVEDARRVAAQLDIPHYVFNLADEFTAAVVEPYAAAYAVGRHAAAKLVEFVLFVAALPLIFRLGKRLGLSPAGSLVVAVFASVGMAALVPVELRTSKPAFTVVPPEYVLEPVSVNFP